MRMMAMAAAGLAALAGSGAIAQTAYPNRADDGTTTIRTDTRSGSSRWGSRIGGQWWGGTNAPGGWRAYRPATRGWALPAYWIAPRFRIGDWQAYGLGRPATGYAWARYYDDAVLIDARGSVFDTVGGIDWDRGDAAYDAGDDAVYAGPDARGGYPARPFDDRRGYADGYGDGYRDGPPLAPRRAPRPPIARDRYRAGGWAASDGTTTITTTNGGYVSGGTTVTVQSTPVVTTTTTTDIYEDAVTYARPAVHKVRRARLRHARATPRCGCAR